MARILQLWDWPAVPSGFEVRREKCVVRDATGLERSFEVERDNLSVPTPTLRPFLRPARAGYIW